MKASIKKYDKGFCDESHTFYRLEIQAENEKENRVLNELNHYLVVWVSPNKSKNGKMMWWGKK